MRDSRHDVLFEPIKIGPVTAKNRFYQVPHCTGTGWLRPRMLADIRATKAEGGWGVVCTEWCSVHPSSDDLPYPNASLWDEGDIRSHALMTEKVHAHGALAGVELWLGGSRAQNLFTREVALDVASLPNGAGYPGQTRAMDKTDIKQMRRWHKAAALRAKDAGFDIVYVYATHGYLLSHFLSPVTNTRTDEYGGNLTNRVRLLQELIAETKDAVGDKCAVAVRFSANKSITSKPVVTVGRFTSPDTMVSHIRRGITDFIGAARPSIADPFLPNKIDEGNSDDIRECIGCNICYTGDGLGVPLHCTQNPTFSEGWRRGWHPENIAPARSASTVLVIGAGPAGLEAARALGQRGYQVLLAEKSTELGGRVCHEAKLPGLSEWIRVRDYRVRQIQQMPNVQVFVNSEMSANDAIDTGAEFIVVATGARWLANGVGRYNETPLAEFGPAAAVFTPDDIFSGRMPTGEVTIYDDDHYYLGGVLAEHLVNAGCKVTLITPDSKVSSWSSYTADQYRIQKNLLELGVQVITHHGVTAFDGNAVTAACIYTDRQRAIACSQLLTITARTPNEQLYQQLQSLAKNNKTQAKICRIGDCDAPSIIATAVFAGHRCAQELEETIDSDNPMRYDRVFIETP